MPRRPTDRTRLLVADASIPTEVRSIVVHDRARVVDLTRRGIAATSFDDVLTTEAETVAGYLHGEVASVFIEPGHEREAAAAADRLQNLKVPTVVVREPLDPERLP